MGYNLAKHSFYLYIRTFIALVITLITSRVVLKVLGIDDYGVYYVVAGVVSLLSVINTSMAGATSRFLTFELGRNDQEKLLITFNSSIRIHVVLSIIVIILGETVGMWYLQNYIELPSGSYTQAQYIFQASLLMAVCVIIQIPYKASIIAHEKMGVFAIIEILNVSLQLIILFFIKYLPIPNLIGYGMLMSIVALTVLGIYIVVGRLSFKECKLAKISCRERIKAMLSYSVWDLYGNCSLAIKQQGSNLLLNRFFGVALNAACGVAVQAGNIVYVFVSNVTVAFRPPIIKSYASKDYKNMQRLLSSALILTLFFLNILILPIILDLSVLLNLWLSEVPPYTLPFCRLIILANILGAINSVLNIVIHATGKIKSLSFISGTLLILVIPISGLFFEFGFSPTSTYWIAFIMMCLTCGVSVLLIKLKVPQISISQLISHIKYPLSGLVISIIVILIIASFIEEGFGRLIICGIVNICISCLLIYLLWIKQVYSGKIKLMLNDCFR